MLHSPHSRAKLLTDMGKAPVFDCGQLCDRAFLIDELHLCVSGYGVDRSGSDKYLQDTLALVKVAIYFFFFALL